MNHDEPNNRSPKKDRRWNQLYWAHIVVFCGFTALIAVEVLMFSPSFPRKVVAIQSVVAAPLPASNAKGPQVQGASLRVPGSKIITPMQNPPASATPQEPDHWSSGDVVSAMSNFYTTIIAILVALIGIMGVLAGFTLRALSRASAEETAHEQANVAMNHYISSRKFAREVGIAVEEAGITAPMEKLEQEVDNIRRLLAKRLDMGGVVDGLMGGEDVDGHVQPQAPGPETV
ncbi:hypothetical protein [Rhodanobacter sp. UC4451_H18]